LSVEAGKEGDLVIIQALIRVTEKLETLDYVGMCTRTLLAYHISLTILAEITQGYTGFAASMNASSLSTLRTLRLQHDIEDDIQDPLCGFARKLALFGGAT
jgi:hypothetical protein